MQITIYNRTNQDAGVFEQLFEKIAEKAEQRLALSDDYELSVNFQTGRRGKSSLSPFVSPRFAGIPTGRGKRRPPPGPAPR